MQKTPKETNTETTQNQNQITLDSLLADMAGTNKTNIFIKRIANAMKEAGIPNCIMAWDAPNSRYVYAGAMPEEIGDGTIYSSKQLARFVRFLEVCTDFDKNSYKFQI